MITLAAFSLLAGMALVLVRLFAGPTLHDRVLAMNSFSTKAILLLACFAFLSGRPDFVDISLLYALAGFAGTIAILKFFRFRAETARDKMSTDTPDTPNARRE